ncbi:peptide/nickel transport system permease protein [Saccharomonospora amisosensis]|uniref:Peptide/nickel transport system permease protein n=1 Tax=Saccharomonospora amisosensis TaxID=1128677 RepID=A0A7X5UN02_9PSEU|nr:ABC transporter permease [Saccharomonospora amisosensis]NIJ10999.1 peptide/nickel transport system permease protein [Saccharomonospora amisosensis]
MAIVEASASSALLAETGQSRLRGWLRHLELAFPVGLLVIIIGGCFLWPVIGSVPDPVGGNVLESNLPAFSQGHLLGTDPNGNDVWSRILYGGRSSLVVGVAVNVLGLLVGGTLGAVSAHVGGVLDAIIMRVLDVLIAFPSLVLTLAVAQSLGPSQTNTIFALAFFSVPAFARVARAATLRLREQPFMTAARLSGTSGWRMLFRHIAPNIIPQLVTFAMLGMGIIIVIEGALSFLGLGIPPPAPSWGNMISQGQQALSATPMLVVWPSVVLFLTVLAFNLLGETLRARWSGR